MINPYKALEMLGLTPIILTRNLTRKKENKRFKILKIYGKIDT